MDFFIDINSVSKILAPYIKGGIMKKKNYVFFMVMAAFILSAFTIWSITKINQVNSFDSYAQSIECKAHGDFTPRPLDGYMLAPSAPAKDIDQICSGHGDYKPKPLEPWLEVGDTIVIYVQVEPVKDELIY